MCATYREKQKRSHFESFANKIHTGIREIIPEYAEKRAIWELFQNALDTVDENGIIKIAKTEKGLLFMHNGRPFKDDEFGGLIKQFSVGKTYGNNKEKIGQYGTGFISTHVYGKKIIVNGSIQTDDGSYRSLNDFLLDRDEISVEKLTDKLLEQDERIEKLCDNIEASEHLPMPSTSFEYLASEISRNHIDEMLEYVETILPYIFCFNDKLKEVSLLNGQFNQVYERTNMSNGMVHIAKNNIPLNIPFFSNDEKSVKVILGSQDISLKNIPKQFLFYPLMETAEVGYNFIVHANDFKPNKERDFLYKDNGNEELKEDVENNEKLLELAFNLVLEGVEEYDALLFIEIAKIQFTLLDSQFVKNLKVNFINTIRFLERLDFDNKKHAINSLKYFDESILLLDTLIIKSVYSLLKQFYSLPSFELFCELSSYINNWNDNLDEKFKVLTLDDVGEIIATESGGNYFYIIDKESFQIFISQVSKNISLLNRFKLIPNIHGDFKHFENLLKWNINESSLINIVDCINATISEKYIHKDFEFLENLIIYDREKFKDEFSKFCNELSDYISKDKEKLTFSEIRFSMLIESLTNFITLNKKTQLNIDISTFYERVFQLLPHPIDISDPTVDINYQPAIKLLANLYVKNISTNEISEHIGDLKEIISIMYKNTNLKEELLHKLACLPNQNYILKTQTELKRDDVKDNEFKDKFDTITNNIIRNELAYEGFETFLQHSGSVSGSQLGEEIETFLNSEKRFIPVDKGIIDLLLTLIEKISEKPNTWGQWLRNINGVKEEILMHKFKDVKIRSSLFSILTKNEKTIELLGDLAKIENLQDLVDKGKERQKEENRKTNHLNYINYIGLTIQGLIQEQLDISLTNVVSVLKSEENKELTTQEEQNGQDFIVYKNKKPIYYLEVKSKWDENGRFALSKNQTEKCALEKNQYAVISVNVDRYKRKYTIDIDNIPFQDLKEFVKVNDNLGSDFQKLILENVAKIELNEPKLIEYRGSIPQKLIDDDGVGFDDFIKNLIEKIRIA